MAYVITDDCLGIRGCEQACPYDKCIVSDGTRQYINPEICTSCTACSQVCPADAIYFIEDLPLDKKDQIKINKDFFNSKLGD